MPAPVRVPASCIANKPVDFVEEIFSCLAVPLTVGKLTLPPPVLGCFALLEMIDSAYFRKPERASFLEAGRALAIFRHRREAAAWVRAFVEDQPEALDNAARATMKAGGAALLDRLPEVSRYLLESPWTGFEMIPGGSRTATAFLFDGVALGALALLGSSCAGVSAEAALWEVPLTLLGHLAAANAKANGKEGVSRPKDPDDIRRQLKLARERAERGEVQPWQI